MNKKGFTLIELIMVIVLIAILSLILIPNIFTLLNKSKISSCESLKKNIESAAKTYVINNKYELNFSCNTPKDITLETLIIAGDLKVDSSGQITNPLDDSIIALSNTISVTYNCSSKTFTYVINGINCH